MDHFAWTVALTRMISAVFRRGGDVAFVVEELKAVFDRARRQWMGGAMCPRCWRRSATSSRRHMISIGFIPDPTAEREGLLGKLAVNSCRRVVGRRHGQSAPMPEMRPAQPGGVRKAATPALIGLFEMRVRNIVGNAMLGGKADEVRALGTNLVHLG